MKSGLGQKCLECSQLRLAAEDGLRVTRCLEQRLMRFRKNEDENGVLVAGAVARLLEREVLGEEAREVRIELGDCNGVLSNVAVSGPAFGFAGTSDP